jgi:hypothetical protein
MQRFHGYVPVHIIKFVTYLELGFEECLTFNRRCLCCTVGRSRLWSRANEDQNVLADKFVNKLSEFREHGFTVKISKFTIERYSVIGMTCTLDSITQRV